MSTSKKPSSKEALEERKVIALEKIATGVDALTLWFEEIDKEDWDSRVQYYLNEFHQLLAKDKDA